MIKILRTKDSSAKKRGDVLEERKNQTAKSDSFVLSMEKALVLSCGISEKQARRRAQICAAAKTCFLEKNFSATTMEDVVSKSHFSKGGVYYYYKSTLEMLSDIMIAGNYYRISKIEESVKTQRTSSTFDLLVKTILDKVNDKSEYKSLYAMFLIEAKKNKSLESLRLEIFEKSKAIFKGYVEEHGLLKSEWMFSDSLIAFVDSMIVASEMLYVGDMMPELENIIRNAICAFK